MFYAEDHEKYLKRQKNSLRNFTGGFPWPPSLTAEGIACVVHPAPQSRKGTPELALVIFTHSPWRLLVSVEVSEMSASPQEPEHASPEQPEPQEGRRRLVTIKCVCTACRQQAAAVKRNSWHGPAGRGDTSNLLQFLPCLTMFWGPFWHYCLQTCDSKMGTVNREVLVLGEMHWDLLLIQMLWKEFQPFTATGKSNGLFKNSETTTDIQSKCSATHLRFIAEETMIQVHQQSCSSALHKSTTIWPFLCQNHSLLLT